MNAKIAEVPFIHIGWFHFRPLAVFISGISRVAALASLCLTALTALAQPTVSNVTASQTAGTRSVAITYTLSHPQSLPCTVTLLASRDNGAT